MCRCWIATIHPPPPYAMLVQALMLRATVHEPKTRMILQRAYNWAASVGLAAMSLGRHASHYAVIGGIQWLLDWGVMVGLSHLGMAVEPANVCGRIVGALFGYWLNGKFTFAGDDTEVGRTQLRRFLLMWLCTTLISTWAMGSIDDWFGLKWAWLAKPGVELLLGAAGFLLSRHWVYKKHG